MISVITKRKVKDIAGIETQIDDVKSFLNSDDVMHYCMHHDMPFEILLDDSEESECLDKKLDKYCKNLKIKKPKIIKNEKSI